MPDTPHRYTHLKSSIKRHPCLLAYMHTLSKGQILIQKTNKVFTSQIKSLLYVLILLLYILPNFDLMFELVITFFLTLTASRSVTIFTKRNNKFSAHQCRNFHSFNFTKTQHNNFFYFCCGPNYYHRAHRKEGKIIKDSFYERNGSLNRKFKNKV